MATSFSVNLADLAKILEQIKIAERHAAGENLVDIIGQDAALLPLGLRTVDGSFNNLLPGQSLLGAADGLFPRMLTPSFRNDLDGDTMPLGPVTITNTDYAAPGSVADADPRIISNLIVDQSVNNPAVIEAWLANPIAVATWLEANPGKNPVAPGAVLDPLVDVELTNADLALIPNLSPDIGLSPANSAFMTFFGQFFDHGLDLVTKGGNGTVFVPLQPDDPLIPGADGILGTADDLPVNQRFMAVTRVTPFVNPATGLLTESQNTTTPFVDQNQTYTSNASHQVFLREYTLDGAGHPVNTGHLLEGVNGGIANWGEVKAQAASVLGIALSDFDVHNVPLLRVDAYGKFIPGANGFAQLIVGVGTDGVANTADDVVVEGNPLAPIDPTTVGALRTGHAFLNDIAHHAAPGVFDHDNNPATASIAQTPDTDPGVTDDGLASTYDDEMLNAHFVTGDGRGNENIGLTSVHFIFHAEHNRLVEANKQTILASGDLAVINEWLSVDVAAVPTTPAEIDALQWDGERLFQAARFVTEMQYQHLVFEEFARRVQPNVDPFVFTNSADIDPSIVAEFAHTVYRFGHSMLTDTVDRLDNNLNLVNGDTSQVGLIEAFLNPQLFTGSSGAVANDAAAAGAIIRGTMRATGNEIDEFVVDSLRNNLLGLPLDLAAINMARGRETGVPSLNAAREQFYAQTNDAQVKPYTSWANFAENLKNIGSIVNFIAAYGTHSTITSQTTTDGKRDAAVLLVVGGAGAPADRLDFLNGAGAWSAANSGLNDVDFWVGGLAERKMEFGGMLGSTFNFVFENQMEKLQNGDRFYYLSRTQGMNLLNQLEPNTFADLVMRNTDLSNPHATHISANIFGVPDMILELDPLVAQAAPDPIFDNPIQQGITPKVTRVLGTTDVDGNGFVDGNVLKFLGGEHVVLGGTEGNDSLYGDKGIDTLWGDAGNDYLNPGMESDNVFGGDGDDIIEDPFGDDLLRGEGGNDVISNGHGLDILFGGAGKDFLTAATDTTEMFAGEGDDFLLGGTAADVLLGNEGDDWIEGGDGFDGLSGENSELFFNSPIVGHDVLNGQGNDTDYDGENGDDIMVQGPGIQRSNGMDGFDWAIHKGDPNGADSDLGIRPFETRAALILRDRFDSVEGLSGWNNNDTLTGAAKLILGENFRDALTQAGVDRIDGLRETLNVPLGAPTDVVFDADVNLGGEILLGGAGNDAIRGNLGNDVIDGDAWLNVRISVRANKDDPLSPEIFTVDSLTSIVSGTGNPAWDGKGLNTLMLSGVINPGQLNIAREILNSDGSAVGPGGTTNLGGDIDVAIFSDSAANYIIEGSTLTVAGSDIDGDGFITIEHTPVAGGGGGGGGGGGAINDGIDKLRNIEVLQFADGIAFLDAGVAAANSTATGVLGITQTNGALNDPNIIETGDTLTANLGTVADANGLPAFSAFSLVWQFEQTPGAGDWTNILDPVDGFIITGPTFKPTAAFGLDGLRLRVVGSFRDALGIPEVVFSDPTLELATGVNTPPVAADTIAGVLEDGVLAGVVSAADVDGQTLTFALVGGVAQGALTFNANGTFDYTPNPDFNGPDTFTFTAFDGFATSNVGTVTIDVASVNDAPTGADKTVAIAEDTTYTFSAADFGFADPGDAPDDTLQSVIIAALPANGVLALAGAPVVPGQAIAAGQLASLTWTPAANAFGVGLATMSFQVVDNGGVLNGGVNTDQTANVITFDVASVFDAPTDIQWNAATPGAALLPANGVIATLGAIDPDSAPPFSFTLVSQTSPTGSFSVSSAGAVTRSGGRLAANATYVLNLRTTDASGMSFDETIRVLTGHAGPNVLTGDGGDDVIYGERHHDALSGLAGNDSLFGQNGNDTLTGGAGNDLLNGGAGVDTAVFSGPLADYSFSLSGANLSVTDNVAARDGQDTLVSFNGENVGFGAALYGLRYGSIGANVLTGGGASDVMLGFNGSDRLDGNAGVDVMFGGAGADVFTFDDGDSGIGALADIIRDFETGDQLDFARIDANTGIGGGGGNGQAFSLTDTGGTGAFTAAGQLRFQLVDTDGLGGVDSTMVQGNVNATMTADFEVLLQGYTGALGPANFVV